MPGKVYLNGLIVAPEAASISVFDRGFLYGDSVFETLRVYGGRPFKLTAHLERFFASGSRIGFAPPWNAADIEAAVLATISATGLSDLYLRIIATRGSGPVGLDPALAVRPSLLILALELPPLPAAMYENGRSACLVRTGAQRSPDPQAKTGNYLHSVVAVQQAHAQGADEAIIVDAEGRVTEASSANIFVRLRDIWCTPPVGVGILSGITRQSILALCREQRIAAEERILWATDLEHAQEIFICASVREIVPIVRLEGRAVGSGSVGPATRALHALYRALVPALAQT